jgi:hypothetical protein
MLAPVTALGTLASFGLAGHRRLALIFRYHLRLALVQATRAILAARARLGGALLQRFPFLQRHDLLAMNFELLLADLHEYRLLEGQNINDRAPAVRRADLFVA